MLLGAAFLWPALAGCANTTFDEAFGDAIEQNKAAHIVNPEPAAIDVPDLEGARAALALRRYKRGQVIQPGAETISVD
jgi:hypothetical protein